MMMMMMMNVLRQGGLTLLRNFLDNVLIFFMICIVSVNDGEHKCPEFLFVYQSFV